MMAGRGAVCAEKNEPYLHDEVISKLFWMGSIRIKAAVQPGAKTRVTRPDEIIEKVQKSQKMPQWLKMPISGHLSKKLKYIFFLFGAI